MKFLRQSERGDNSWWLYIVGIIVVAFSYFIGSIPLGYIVYFMQNKYNISDEDITKYAQTNDFTIIHIHSNIGLLLMLCIFIFAFIGMNLVLKLHQKNLLDVITTRTMMDWKRVFYGFLFWMMLTFLGELIFFVFNPTNYSFHLNIGSFMVLLLIGFIILPIQTSFEEIFFRGYFTQGVYHHTKLPVVALISSALFFSLVHSQNPEVKEFGIWTMQLYYIGAAFFLGIITYLDEGMELALGIHAATNIYGVLFMKYEGGVLQTDTLFSMKDNSVWPTIIAFYISAFVFYYFASKKYSWKSPKFFLNELTKLKSNTV